MEGEAELWSFLERHLRSIYEGDPEGYRATTHEELALYEWFVTPHRLDGLPFHLYMTERRFATGGRPYRIDLLERRLQRYGEVAIFSYTLLLTVEAEEGLRHRAVNESRIAVRFPEGWKVVHVHKSPAG
ncbi:nuclear transport factor 2 family protein [Thermus thermamylovorans]|uniref:Protein kinase n=1 Tax=Thermus thermamylovorans TaxID=2509362 RepID=A0A4Q9B6X5_9DEIN|nr:nuclear transport factor 2 family protein [Thermus thermamylovorans]TBH21464.1 protein kinase [Thermus thermamylovorans]